MCYKIWVFQKAIIMSPNDCMPPCKYLVHNVDRCNLGFIQTNADPFQVSKIFALLICFFYQVQSTMMDALYSQFVQP